MPPDFPETIRKFFKGANDNIGMIKILRSFVADETAVTAIEYALIAGGLSIVILTAVDNVGSTLQGIFATVSSQLP